LNKLQVLKYDDDNLSIDIIQSFDMQEEVWLLTGNNPISRDIALASKTDVSIGTYGQDWSNKFTVQTASRPTSLCWDEKIYFTTCSEVFQIDPNSLASTSIHLGNEFSAVKVDPNHKFLLALASGNDLVIHDTREKSTRYLISPAHGDKVLDLDFNPNYPYHIASCSKDYLIKFWDMRKQSCLKTIDIHSHFVFQVKFNSFHDQLVLSSSSDNSVALHRVVSASSAPCDETFFEKESDQLVSRVDNFEDSVYACTWLSGEAWHFASVSYDGKVLVSAVPSEEKYKILL
jgi:WD40 repeat protein